MRERTLGLALGAAGIFAIWPMFTWLAAQFNWLHDGWFQSLGNLAYTFPIALAAAAVVFVVHGLILNAELAEVLEERFSEAATLPQGVVAPSTGVAAAGTTAVATRPATATAADPTVELPVEGADGEDETKEPAKSGGKMAVAERPKGFKDAKEDKKSKKAKKVGKQVGQRWGYKAKGAVRRGIRDRIGIRF